MIMTNMIVGRTSTSLHYILQYIISANKDRENSVVFVAAVNSYQSLRTAPQGCSTLAMGQLKEVNNFIHKNKLHKTILKNILF